LLDSNAKKTRFVQQAILELKLKNVTVFHRRVEHYQPEQTFNTVITRAFASLSHIVELTEHLLGKDGVLLAMKGQNPEAELAQVTAKTTLIPVNVPGREAERCLVRVSAHG
jgi:16S rRNA (guanine527-N7)-methyltransferase